MLIQEMTRQTWLDFLARHQLGRLACAREGQPYITPLYFAHQDAHLYSFSTIGQKIEWMRGTIRLCAPKPMKWSRTEIIVRHSIWPLRGASEDSRM